ncbi:TetR/AcrR family transcriptional regulator C-terminal domain-containing protein [Streptomyces sp. R-74717]|uniref:TetR/AcrR family transcriptional regulator C-terminal domain-containing protein n=1 Tax=Streptomyces TaxID=1883 RepID=UPI0037B3F8CA
MGDCGVLACTRQAIMAVGHRLCHPHGKQLNQLRKEGPVVHFEHPALARAALAVHPSGRNYLALLETLLALLHEGGVPDDRAAWGVDVLLQTATATAAEHATRGEADDAKGQWDALAAMVRDAPATTHPRLAALGAELFTGTPQERLAWVFRVLLNGIRHTPCA